MIGALEEGRKSRERVTALTRPEPRLKAGNDEDPFASERDLPCLIARLLRPLMPPVSWRGGRPRKIGRGPAGASGIDVLVIARRELPAAEALDSGAVNRS